MFSVVKLLGLHSNPDTHQGVISVTVHAVVAPCVEDAVERITPGDDEVKLVTMTSPEMSADTLRHGLFLKKMLVMEFGFMIAAQFK